MINQKLALTGSNGFLGKEIKKKIIKISISTAHDIICLVAVYIVNVKKIFFIKK